MFPSTVINDVVEIAERFAGMLTVSSLTEDDEHISGSGKVVELLDIHDTLCSPFIRMYYRDEIPSRQLVRENGVKVFKEKTYHAIINRLNRGISLTSLLNLLESVPERLRIPYVSAFLDNSIDEGIVVPITVCENGKVFRAFRHGEDVQFCQQEERLCYDMLSAFAKASKRDTLQRLWVEKMLVLLFQIGEGEYFEPLQMALKPYLDISGTKKVDVVSVRYYLQGPVLLKKPVEEIVEKPYLEYADKANWLTTKLMSDEQSPLKQIPDGLYYFDFEKYKKLSEGDSQIVVDGRKTQFAKSLGSVFGQLIYNDSNSKQPSINSPELVMLTSCLETRNAIGAMAAEIDICSKQFETATEGIKDMLDKILGSHVNISDGFKWIHNHNFYQALNDGVRKFIWYRTNRAYETINEVSLGFEDDLYKNIWEGFWSPNLEKRGNNEPQYLIDLANTEGLWLLCLNSYFIMLEYMIRKNKNVKYEGHSLLDRLEQTYDVIKQSGKDRLVKEIIPIIIEFKAKCSNLDFIEGNIDIIYKRLIQLINRAPKILEDCKLAFSQRLGMSKVQNYHHALYVECENDVGLKTVLQVYESMVYRSNCRVKHAASSDKYRGWRQFYTLRPKIGV